MVHDIYNGLLEKAHHYSVSPFVFIFLYLLTWPMVWHSWFILLSAHKSGDKKKFTLGIWYNRVATLTPYLYVLAFGRNFPVWFVTSGFFLMVALTIIFKLRLGSGLLVAIAKKAQKLRKKLPIKN